MRVYLGSSDMVVYPAPRIVGKRHGLVVAVIMIVIMVVIVNIAMVVIVNIAMVVIAAIVVVVTIAIVVVVVAIRKVMAVNVHAAMVIAVRLVHKRAAYRIASIAERDGKSAFALHDLGHAINVTAAETHEASHKRDAAESHKSPADRTHRRFLLSTNEASERSMAE